MNQKDVELFLLSQKAAESGLPFGPQALVFKVMGKMFAVVSQQEAVARVTLKGTPADVAFLVDEFAAIKPGYYMDKKHWMTISLSGEIDDGMLQDLIIRSYHLVVAKLKKSERDRLTQQE
ncbi:MmcQ/YjbR family DNA-binding protein [Winslowiella iniecta]|uniref:MmcQ-like protein n=1 Tax=Winslowiella iniecta TaxID=1560201 RepID=A0A0L7TI84_9GAMM|nr:MmcQ/YjbR family DNA-binding protein [Winslowiella iniecta]KOC91921.1 hypothetical protein NG42_03975 [Winslowiella iniecta]KOC94956.1 hypothetical protein NG43_01735 [Winslowiella iniecta]